MSVKPQIKEFLEQVEKIKSYLVTINFKPNQTNTREALANMTRAHVTDYNLNLFALDDVVMNGCYPVPIRIYHPKPGQALPVAIFIHGGGHMCGSIPVYDGIVRKLTEHIEHIVVAVDYRLAPEFPYPTGLEDTKMAIMKVFEVLDERHISYHSQELTLIGDSGGGALCTSLVMDKELVAKAQITKQVLIYPSTDYTLSSTSFEKFGSGYLLEKTKVAWYFDNYFQHHENRKQLSPLYGNFYPTMPATLVIVASHDPLNEEGRAYYHNVAAAGNRAKLMEIDGVIHAYLMLENLCKPECEQTYSAIANFLQE